MYVMLTFMKKGDTASMSCTSDDHAAKSALHTGNLAIRKELVYNRTTKSMHGY